MDIIEAETRWGRLLKVILLCILALTPLVPVLLLLGYKRLRQIPEDDPNYKFLKWILIAGLAVLVAVGLYFVYFFTQVREGENESFVTWLPPSATNVSYYRSFHIDAHEFDISEEHFLALFKLRDQLEPVKDAVTVTRYTKYYKEPRPETEHAAVIKNGLYYTKKINGRTFCVAYDRNRKRAYFYSEQPPEE